MSLETLLVRAGIDSYRRALWFKDCIFDGQNLICPDEDLYGSIQRQFLERLRAVVPTLELKRGAVAKSLPRPAKSIWKKGYEPSPQKLDGY